MILKKKTSTFYIMKLMFFLLKQLQKVAGKD